MKDRLSSLYRHSRGITVLNVVVDEEECSNSDEFLLKIFAQREALIVVRRAVDRISQLHHLLLAALDTSGPDVDAVNEMIKTLDGEFQEVDRRSASICSAINEMREESRNGMDDRIRKDQLAGMAESLRDVLMKFNRSYVEYQEATRQRALDYSQPLTEEGRLVEFADEKSMGEEQPQLQRTISAYQAVLQEIVDRQETITRVEQSIEELGRMFHELRIYTENGGNLTDCIEKNIEITGDYVEKSLLEMGITVQREEKIRKGLGCMGRSLQTLRCTITLLLSFLILCVTIFILSFLRMAINH